MSDSLLSIEALRSPEGQQLLDRLGHTPIAAADVLSLGTALRREYDPALVAAALTLHDLRIRAAAKFPADQARRMWFTRAGLEQASSAVIAGYRATRFAGRTRVADLCCGIGGDLVALAAVTLTVGVDRDPVHLRLAEFNAEFFGVSDQAEFRNADVQSIALDAFDGLFIDPARRSERGRYGPHHTEPPLDWCLSLSDRVSAVGIKAAPGIDHERIPDGWEQEFIAIGREMKEAALWSPGLASTPRRATIFPGPVTLTASSDDPIQIAAPGAYLYDPNPAVTRASLVEDLARQLGAWKIDDQIAFLSADERRATPFARTLGVLDSLPWREKDVAARLRALDIGVVDIRRRGLAGDVETIRRRLKLKGAKRATLVMTRAQDQPWCLICDDSEIGPLPTTAPAEGDIGEHGKLTPPRCHIGSTSIPHDHHGSFGSSD